MSTLLENPVILDVPLSDAAAPAMRDQRIVNTVDLAQSHDEFVKSRPAGDLPRLVLPGADRPDSDFTTECGHIIGARNIWFLKGGLVVEVRRKTFTNKIHHLALHVLRPVEVCTAIEDYIEIGSLVNGNFVRCSMSDRRANILINSPQFKRELPEIDRVVDYQIPIIHEGQLIYPAPGFDSRFGIYTNPDAPKLFEMDIRTAKMWLHELLKDFCFDGQQSLTHAIARLLTPMCRAITGWDARGPFWIFTANRERLGKDYLAVLARIFHQARRFGCVPRKLGYELIFEVRNGVFAARGHTPPYPHYLSTCRGSTPAAQPECSTLVAWLNRDW